MSLPRGLILLASAWLFLSWIATMGVHPPLIAATASYTPSVRLMMLASVTGALVGWPLLRLSQGATTTPLRDTALDLIVLLGMLNMVLWPLRLVTPWPVARMALLMGFITLGVLTVGAVVAAVTPSRRSWLRSAAMALVILYALGFIPWRAVAGDVLPPFPSIFGGPLEAIAAAATSGGAPPMAREQTALDAAVGVALLAWSAAFATLAWRRFRAHRRLPAPGAADTLVSWN